MLLPVIEEDWQARQRAHFAGAPWFLYHDRSSDPDTLSVEAVGRGNLLALVELGYNGPSAAAMRELVEAGSHSTLCLQDPSGQVPANGRTDDHVRVDIGYQLAFEVMAERSARLSNERLAGQYRHAAMLAFQNIARWRRTDEPWEGSYFITKNPLRSGLARGLPNSQRIQQLHRIAHVPSCGSLSHSPHRDRRAAGASRNPRVSIYSRCRVRQRVCERRGLQMQLNLRGDTGESSGNYWTPMGVVRFARAGWDTRLGPADGALTGNGGVSFAPAFNEQGHWVLMAGLSARYQAEFTAGFTHPALVLCAISYRPRAGQSGPSFRNDFTITPDGILSELTSQGLRP